jgi:hypothetical protein
MGNLSVFQIWEMSNNENWTKEMHIQVLKDNGHLIEKSQCNYEIPKEEDARKAAMKIFVNGDDPDFCIGDFMDGVKWVLEKINGNCKRCGNSLGNHSIEGSDICAACMTTSA